MSLHQLIYIPELAIAFEYQGEPHYLNIPIYGSLKQRQLNDTLKHINSQGIYSCSLAHAYSQKI